MAREPAGTGRHFAIALVSAAYLAVAFLFARHEAAVLIAVVVPTLVAAYLYGFPGGLIAGIGGALVNATVLLTLRADPWVADNAIPTLIGASTNILLGLLFGSNRSLVRELRVTQAKIQEQALIDELTGCYNRRHAFPVLNIQMRDATRYGYPLSIVYIDLDNLKAVNDAHGHARGDDFIRAFAKSATTTVRATDIVCRMGGDEFLVILPHCSESCARRVVGRIVTTFTRHWSPSSEALFSWGVAGLESDDTVDSFVARADAGMYDFKRLRRSGAETPRPDDDGCAPPGDAE